MITQLEYYALVWCRDMAAQDHRAPETEERLRLAREALRKLRDLPVPRGVYFDDRDARTVPGRVSFTVLEKKG